MFDFSKIPNWLRWIGFIPALFIAVLVSYFVINIFLDGLSRYMFNDTIYYILSRIAFNFFGITFCLFSSISMIPKGKIILSSIYLGLIIIIMSAAGTSFLFVNNGEYEVWHMIYEALLTAASGIISLVYTIIWEKEQKEKSNKTIYVYET